MDATAQVQEELTFHKVTNDDEFPEWAPREKVVDFLYRKMEPYNDEIPDIEKGLDYSFAKNGGRGGFTMLANLDGELVGILVMLKTGMSGFIPDNILLYVSVDPEKRGKGLGRKLIEHCLNEVEGDVKLHVEYDNPAKRLYERIGFTTKYAEMRFIK